MTPYQHRLNWVRALNVTAMDSLIKQFPERSIGAMIITVGDESKKQHISDVMQLVREAREEFRKDELMKRKQERNG